MMNFIETPCVRFHDISNTENHICFFCGEQISQDSKRCSECGLLVCPSCNKCYCAGTSEEKAILQDIHENFCQNLQNLLSFKTVSGSTNIHVNANQCLKECSRLANENLKLNLGCGAELLPDYINIDLQDFHNPGRFYYVKSDAGKLNFLKDKVVKEILCKHLIEHIHPLLIKEFLYEWRRVLRPDGLLILLFPDFDRIIDKYQSIKNLNSVQDLMDFLDLNYGVLNTTMDESLVKADRHRCLMTRRFLDIMLGSEGFKIKSYESIDRCYSKLTAEKVWVD